MELLKLEYYFSSDFRDMHSESNVCCFRRDKNVVLGTKKGQLAFLEMHQQLVNSGNNLYLFP